MIFQCRHGCHCLNNKKYHKRESIQLIGSFDRFTGEFGWSLCAIRFLRFKRRFDPLIDVRVFLATYRPTTGAGKSNLFCFSFRLLPRPPSTTPSPFLKLIVRFAPGQKVLCLPPRQSARRLYADNRTLLDGTTRSRINGRKGIIERKNKSRNRRREINKYKNK